MEAENQPLQHQPQAIENRLHFNGTGGTLFEIYLINFLLSIITLGMYYPWARERMLKYIYGETSFFGSRLAFHGTGREMFIGFVKALLLLGIFGAGFIYFYLEYLDQYTNGDPEKPFGFVLPFIAMYGVGFLFMMTITPLAIHGAMKYRLAKTSWRGIRLGYRGERPVLYGIFIRDFLLTLITLGIYRSWLEVNMRRYIVKNIRFGDVTFSFNGDGMDLFVIRFKGVILSILTFGIYYFWYSRDLYNFRINNMRVHQQGREYRLISTASVSDIFELMVLNWLMVTFTFGIATPWAIARQLRFYMGNAYISEGFDPNLIIQTEQDYNDALAEDLSDMFDLGIV